MSDPLADLPRNHFGAILADPPWDFKAWTPSHLLHDGTMSRERHYGRMEPEEIRSLPVSEVAAPDCVLFVWIVWPSLKEAVELIEGWGFKYKTCAFAWVKANNSQPSLFVEEIPAQVGMGYWTRSNSEVCLLATRGKPKRLNADVRQGIIEPRREHSRKPDCTHERIERLVAGPYLELFARKSRPGWTTWGNEATKFDRTLEAAE